MSAPREKVAAAWGPDAPDWVLALADESEATSQAKAAALLGYTPAVVSGVLNRTYPAPLGKIEELVRARIMGAEVNCPALGTLPLDECRDWRAKAGNFIGANSLRVRMYRACSHCPLALKEREQ